MSNTFSAEELTAFRNDTTGCAHVIHLNNAGAALMPDPVTRAIQDHIALEARIGGYEAAKASEASIAQFYTQTANLLHCTPENIAFTTSATDSFIRALSSIPFRTGDVILTDNDNYISNQIQFLSLQKRQGIRLVRIKNAAIGGVDLADLEEQLYRLKPRLLAITHIPTNTVVSCQDEKSQIKNREKGMRVLRSRLYEIEMEKQQAALAKERRAMVGSGDRSEKIRTYNFPQNRLTDHRIGFTIHQLEQVMDGKLQPLIEALTTHYQAEKLKQEASIAV